MIKIVSLLCVVLMTPPRVYAADDTALARTLPAAIAASDDLRRHMVTMLYRSPTFRRQCGRLDVVAGLRVDIQRDPWLRDGSYRARTIITRMKTGEMTALVAITALGDPSEWLSHEIEHVIEQLDGVRLSDQRDAWPTNDMFETWRAIRVGRAVLAEMRGAVHSLAHGRLITAPGDN